MTNPTTYRKMIASRFSRNFHEAAEIVETDFPEPKPDQIIIKNHYAGVNATDPNITAGLYTPGKQPPIDLGAESIGEVVATGDEVKGLNIGDPVVTLNTGSGYREYAPVKSKYAFKVPDITPEILTLALSGLTASIGLETVGEMGSSETVLVTAAAGGTGHIAVQLAKNAGNHVIGTCGSQAKADFLRELGVDRVVQYKDEDLNAVLKTEYPDGINLVYESIGRETFDTALKRLAIKGRLVIIGFITEYTDEPEQITGPRIYTRLLTKSASLRSMFLPHYMDQAKSHLGKLNALLKRGKLHVAVDPTRFQGIESIPDAVDHLQSGQNAGKVIVRYV